MNKNDVITKIAKSTGYTKKDVSVVYDATFDTIKSVLSSGEGVAIHGFGKFSCVDVAERSGINSLTGEKYTSPAHKRPKFAASNTLKDAVR